MKNLIKKLIKLIFNKINSININKILDNFSQIQINRTF